MADREMPKYRCHKVVHALKIREVSIVARRILPTYGVPVDGVSRLFFEDGRYTPINVRDGWLESKLGEHNTAAGGYYVVYEDGYVSWSPGDVFEAGYTLVDEGNEGPDDAASHGVSG